MGEITEISCTALTSQSWGTKAQAARTVSSLAEKLGESKESIFGPWDGTVKGRCVSFVNLVRAVEPASDWMNASHVWATRPWPDVNVLFCNWRFLEQILVILNSPIIQFHCSSMFFDAIQQS